MPSNTCLIVGAGMCGLTAAAELRRAGWTVIVLDKGRQPGGRIATRRLAGGVFDYGAQFFSVRSPEFRERAESWERSGLVRVWTNGFAKPGSAYKPDGHPRYCGVDGMNSLPAHLAAELLVQGVDIVCEAKVESLEWTGQQWQAATPNARYSGQVLLLTPPVPQSLELLRQSAIDLPALELRYLAAAKYESCLSILLQSDDSARLPDPGAIIDSDIRHPISFLSDNSRKGVSPLPGSLTLHSNWHEAELLWDQSFEITAPRFAEYASNVIGPFAVVDAHVHRWRYSKPVGTFDFRALSCHHPGPMVFAGDLFAGARIEGAFLSGLEAARQVCNIP